MGSGTPRRHISSTDARSLQESLATLESARLALLHSRHFLALGTPEFLEKLREGQNETVDYVIYAKHINKPVVLGLQGLNPDQEKELLGYFQGHNVVKIIRADTPQALAVEIAKFTGPQS